MKRKKSPQTKAKDKCWAAFSYYIRTRDCIETTGCPDWGLCVTCGKRYHIKLLQAGHFIPGRNNAVLWCEKGTHAQCYNCNINLKGNTLPYRRFIVRKYGKGYDEFLEAQANRTIQYKQHNYELMEEDYKMRTKKLREGK